jgi:leucyl/phenylalanyl-tRNA---protein transferase
MPIRMLDDTLWFPPLEEANEDGLLAVGGDLTPGRLLLAYQSGIFPWFNEDEIPLWWSPNPRFVLFPDELRVSHSMQQVLRSNRFSFDEVAPFREIVTQCRAVNRPGQNGTWITPEIRDAYCQLHELEIAHAAGAWQNGRLVGGLYGIRLGATFFGESMFSLVPNASKFTLINWVRHLATQGVKMIDCQVYTPHLESLGARMIARTRFIENVTEGNH